jgi:hypothetical protein
MPPGTDVTAPSPVPDLLTLSMKFGGRRVKFAVTFIGPVTSKLQVSALPLHAPDQLTNADPASGIAVRTIDASCA